jgi:hypothetical protein
MHYEGAPCFRKLKQMVRRLPIFLNFMAATCLSRKYRNWGCRKSLSSGVPSFGFLCTERIDLFVNTPRGHARTQLSGLLRLLPFW